MLKSTRAFCEYIINLYTTGYNPSRAAICTLYFAMATFHFRRFPRFSWFSLLSVVLSESVACRRRWLRRWRRRRRDVDVSISMSIISAVDECNACMRAARVERGAFLLPLLPIPVPRLSPFPSPLALSHLSGNEAVMQICWPPFRAVSSKVAQKQQAKAKAKAMHSG